MKTSKIICAILFFVLLLSLLCGCETAGNDLTIEYYTSEDNLAEYVMENQYMSFRMDGQTSYFTLTDKQSGEVWHSVPENGATDSAADATMRKWLQSTMILTYTVPSGINTIFDNYSNSIANNAFRITELEDGGIQVDYLIGEQVRVYRIPEVVSEARFNQLIENLTKSQQASVKSLYQKIDPEKPPSGQNLDDLKARYPQLADGVIYIQRTGVAEYRFEQVEELLAEQGYTEEDYENDKAVSEDEDSLLQFNVSVIYRLDGDSFVVEVPGESLRCPSDYQMTNLQVLPYFGAGSTEDEGYLLIPDGGGAVVEFNLRKGTASSITSKVYGWDSAKARNKMITENAVQFPVYAIQKNNGYLLAVAENGAAELTLETNTSGNRNSYNSIAANFEVVHGDLVTISSKSGVDIMIYEKTRQYEDLSIRYMVGSGNSYVDMANTYRQYLMNTYPELQAIEQNSLPIAVELIGAMDHITQVVGVPMQTILPATTYEEAAAVVKQLREMDVKDVYVKYTAILNGGLKQTSLLGLSQISELGNQAQLKALAQQASENGGLYLGGYGSLVFDSVMFGGFNENDHAIRNTMSDIVEATPYNTVTYAKITNKAYHIHNAKATQQAVQNMIAFVRDYSFAGIAPEDLGSKVTSDFNQEEPTSRDAMAALHASLLKTAREQGQGVMINSGNAYAVPYADFVLNMDLSGSNYDLVSYQVPFYQIALHGLVNYAGDPINMAQSYEKNILKSVETGAGLYFLFAEIPAAELQMTEYASYSSARFEEWEETLQSLYNRLNKDLGHTYGQKIKDHKYLTDSVTVTVYEDGTHVYVNYSAVDYALNGKTVKSMDYLVTGGNVHE